MQDYTYIVTVGDPDRCVVYGHSTEPISAGDSPKLTRARMVLYWSRECGGLFGLAANGPKTDTRLTAAVTVEPGVVKRVIGVPAKTAVAMDEWPAV
jgi:hypothetical protein